MSVGHTFENGITDVDGTETENICEQEACCTGLSVIMN